MRFKRSWEKPSLLIRFCLFSLLMLGCPPSWAQEKLINEPAVVLQDTVVTGEKVARSLKETASSVSIFDSDDLENEKGASSVADVISEVPNLIYTSTVGAPIIRGQDTQGPNFGSTAFFGGTIPRATINLDGQYLDFYEYVFSGTSIWDVHSIEVFRGPQTTSQGANAIAGAIIVNTNDPTFEPEGAVQAEIGSYNKKRGSVMLSGPIVKDQLAARIAVDYWERDTFIDYINPNFAQGDTDQDFQSLNARAKLLWESAGLPGLSAKLTFIHNESNRPTWEAASEPYDNLESATTGMPNWDLKVNTGVLDINYDFNSGIRLFNQVVYSDKHVDRIMEPYTNGGAVIDQQTVSNEIRMTFGRSKDRISGLGGLYLARTTSDDTLYIQGTSDFDDEKNNLGIYGEATWRPAERWALTGGLRYQSDHIERSGTSNYAQGALDYDKTFDALLPKLALAYDLTDDTTVGVQVSKGYNPGGINLSFAGCDYITFEEETVWNYELFTRSYLLDKRLILTGNLFYSDYRDAQRLLPDYLGTVQYGSIAVNADSAEAYGLELWADYQALDNLRIKAGAGLLHTEIGNFTSATGTTHKGNEFGGAPGYMASLGLDWDIIKNLRLNGKVRFTDGYHSSDENTAGYEVGSYTVADLKLSFSPMQGLQIYGYINNIFDERTPTYLADDRAVGGIVANMLEPRTLGVGVKYAF